ncbi:MAG: ATP-binding cassette domain-containing protein [Acidimicrobiia bacterium]
MLTSAPALSARGISFAYGREPVLTDVDLDVRAGEFAALVGPNGSGKSTLLRILLGLPRPASGTIEIFGQAPVRNRERVAGWGTSPSGSASPPTCPPPWGGRGDRLPKQRWWRRHPADTQRSTRDRVGGAGRHATSGSTSCRADSSGAR